MKKYGIPKNIYFCQKFSHPCCTFAPKFKIMNEDNNKAAWLESLDPEQKTVATTLNESALINGYPGSGKSHTLACRAAYMVAQGVAPQSIAVLTASKATAIEMKRRIEEMAGGMARDILVATPQTLCLELRKIGNIVHPAVYSDAECKAVIREVAQREDTSDMAINHIFCRIRYAKERRLSPIGLEECKEFMKAEKAAGYPDLIKIYRRYVRAMRKRKAIDQYDMPIESILLLFGKPMLHKRFKHLLVDDYECCTLAQASLINRWAGSVETFAITHCLPECKSSNLGYICIKTVEILRNNPGLKQYALAENHRQTGLLAEVRKSFIKSRGLDTTRYRKPRAFPEGNVRLIQAASHAEEAQQVAEAIKQAHDDGVAYADMCVLFNGYGLVRDVFREAFRKNGITFNDGANSVTMTTIESVRGLEYRHVYMVCLNEEIFPSSLALRSTRELGDEQKTFLTGLTRAKEQLVLSYSTSEKPSRFIGYTNTNRELPHKKRC